MMQEQVKSKKKKVEERNNTYVWYKCVIYRKSCKKRIVANGFLTSGSWTP